MRTISLDTKDRRLRIVFDYDDTLVAVVRKLPERRFVPREKAWFVPMVHAERVCALLVDDYGFEVTDEVAALIAQGPKTTSWVQPTSQATKVVATPPRLQEPAGETVQPAKADKPARDALSIKRLNQLVSQAIRQAFSREFWVIGELVSYDRGARGRGRYFELVDASEQAGTRRTVERVGCVLWDNDAARVQKRLARSAEPFALRDGLVVCLKVSADFYAAQSRFQLVVRDIDPVYTLGDLAQKRAMILKMLADEGLLNRNRSLPLSPAPLRIALLTSSAGEAARDFIHTLRSSGFGFSIDLFDCVVQGPRLSWSVCSGIEHAERLHSSGHTHYDAIVVIRGGGSRSDLAWFDDLKVARKVANSPLKVVVGIGHHRDQSVLDLIAMSVKTPTAAATHLVDSVAAYLDVQANLWEQVRHRSVAIVDRQRNAMAAVADRVVTGTRRELVHERQRLVTMTAALEPTARRGLQRKVDGLQRAGRQLATDTRSHLRLVRRDVSTIGEELSLLPRRQLNRQRALMERMSREIELLDPRRVLARGYARIRRGADIIVDASTLERGDQVTIELRDGVATATVEAASD